MGNGAMLQMGLVYLPGNVFKKRKRGMKKRLRQGVRDFYEAIHKQI